MPSYRLFTFADKCHQNLSPTSLNSMSTFFEGRPSVIEVSHAHPPSTCLVGVFWLTGRRQKFLSPTNVGKCEQRVMLLTHTHTHTHTHTSHHIQLSEPTRDRVTSLAALVDAGEDSIKADGGRAGGRALCGCLMALSLCYTANYDVLSRCFISSMLALSKDKRTPAKTIIVRMLIDRPSVIHRIRTKRPLILFLVSSLTVHRTKQFGRLLSRKLVTMEYKISSLHLSLSRK